ncbi:MAG: C1 family peptidase [Clostridium sp.]|nr:C1 family peptidase [Clostridium sp.]
MKKIISVLIIYIITIFNFVRVQALEINSRYDPREEDRITDIRNQGELGTCWAFAGIAALETYLKYNNLGDNDLSEEHMNWWCTPDRNGYGWNRNPDEGSWAEAVIGYFTSGQGIKSEKDITYNSSFNGKKPQNMDTAPTLFDVSEIEYLENDEKSIKEAIYKYGAVCANYIHSDYFVGNDFSSYYDNDLYADGFKHRIAIVGWDDNYSKDNFLVQPEKDGAWLIKNSWGDYNKEGGYLWISYEDCNILRDPINFAIRKAQKTDGKHKIYQHDKYGAISTINKLDFSEEDNYKKLTCANVYDFSEEYNKLSSVRIMTGSVGANYEIAYAKVINNNIDIENKVKLAEGIVEYCGYMDIETNNFYLPKGKGAIVVTIDYGEKEDLAEIGCEISREEWNFKAEVNPNESYILINDKLVDVTKCKLKNPMNFTIKAITELSSDKLITNFTIGSYNMIGLFSNDTFTLSVPEGQDIKDLDLKIAMNNSSSKIVQIGDIKIDKSEYAGKIKESNFNILCRAADGSEKTYRVVINKHTDVIEEKSNGIGKVLIFFGIFIGAFSMVIIYLKSVKKL